jgi:hypothetical protein
LIPDETFFNFKSNLFITLSFSFLVKIKIDGHELPTVLPEHLIPPSKRHLAANESPTSGNASLYPTIGGGENNNNADS